MMRPAGLLPLALACTAVLAGQSGPAPALPPPLHALPPDARRVEITGTIESMRAAPGAGMPTIQVRTPAGLKTVLLGSMRYMMENNFNPKSGATVTVKAFEANGMLYAQSVSVPAARLLLHFRDDKGAPLWRMGRYGRGRDMVEK